MVSEEIIQEILREVQGGNEDLLMIMCRVADEHDVTFTPKDEDQICDIVDAHYFMCGECGWWNEVGYWNVNNPDRSHEVCLDCDPEEDE